MLYIVNYTIEKGKVGHRAEESIRVVEAESRTRAMMAFLTEMGGKIDPVTLRVEWAGVTVLK